MLLSSNSKRHTDRKSELTPGANLNAHPKTPMCVFPGRVEMSVATLRYLRVGRTCNKALHYAEACEPVPLLPRHGEQRKGFCEHGASNDTRNVV